MAIYAIGDTHLSRARHKPMDIFGEEWLDHDEKIRARWNDVATEADLLIVAGDISWAMRLDEVAPDLEFLSTFRGQKLLLKGNHDYWWSSLARVRAIAPVGIDFLQHDARVYGKVAIAGTRGWSLPNAESASEDDARIYRREVERLRLSLASAQKTGYESLVVVMHYPPLSRFEESTEFSDLIERAGAATCVYGHLHGKDIASAPEGIRNGVRYKLVSADAVRFSPWLIWPGNTHR